MNPLLKKLKDLTADTCVTVILNTHRTRPENQKDALVLKNFIKEVETRLLAEESKRDAQALVDRLQELADEIDPNYNLESLILFVNEEVAEYVRLPIEVEDRVVIDRTFATRDLVRALHLETGYFVLVLSQQNVRLIEAFNDKVVTEVGDPFPLENTQFYSTTGPELSNASRQTNLVAEFFNRVDKAVNEVRKEHALPVLVCCEEANYHEYLKIADQKHSIFETFLNQNRLDEKAHHIVSEAWDIVKAHTVAQNQARKAELGQAKGAGRLLNDLHEIWSAILAGRVQTLFIEQDLFQPGLLEGDELLLASEAEASQKAVVDDIYDEMIETNQRYGGEVVFLPTGELSDYEGFAAITRY